MARHTFGGTMSDWAFTFNTDGTVSQGAGAVLTFWSSLAGGTQYTAAPMPGGVDDGTGLLDGTGVPISSVTCDGNGEIPASLQGPDGVYTMAVDGSGNGTGPRRWITANDIGDDLTTLLNAINAAGAPTYAYYSTALASYPVRPDVTSVVWWVGSVAPPVGAPDGAVGADVWLNTTGAAAPGGVASVTAGDGSVVVGGSGSAPTVETGTLDQIAGLHPAAAGWGNAGFPIHNVGAGVASGDVATVGQIYPFVDGSDSAVVMDGTNTFSGFTSKSGSQYTLTRDVFATSLTVNSGVTLLTGAYRIFCTGMFTNNGTVENLGPAASGITGATGSAGSLHAGGTGATGTSGNGSGTGTSPAGAVGTGTGGSGGAGSGKTGGTAQAVSLAATWPFKLPNAVLSGIILPGPASTGNAFAPAGGVGGASGGGDGTNSGGGGGGGGGAIAIFAQTAINTGTISAAGGTGGTPPTGNCGGGGGGGGGIIVIYSVQAWSNTGTTNVNGGNPGSGIGTGAAGTAGGSGSVLNVVLGSQ